MRPGHSWGGGEREAGEVRTLAPHLAFLPGKLLLAPPCNTGRGRYLPLRGPFPNIISSSSHRMTFVFAEITSKGKHPGRISGEGQMGKEGGGRHSDREELKGPFLPPLPPEWEPVTSGCPHPGCPHPGPHKISPFLLVYTVEN